MEKDDFEKLIRLYEYSKACELSMDKKIQKGSKMRHSSERRYESALEDINKKIQELTYEQIEEYKKRTYEIDLKWKNQTKR